MEISVIIPAYNEEKNIGNVLSVLSEMDELEDILVVNDGSTDGTGDIVRQYSVRVMDLPFNQGKGKAMWIGFQHTRFPVVLFLDADLMGLKAEQIRQMIYPVYLNRADMTLGIFSSGRSVTDLAQKFTPFLTGQRCINRKSFLELDSDQWLSGYGIEIALTRYAKDNNLKVIEVPLENVTHCMKEEKLGIARGVVARLKMYWELAKEINR